MVDIALMSAITQRSYDSVYDPDLGFRLSQEQGAPIAGGRATVKIGFNLPARDTCKRECYLRTFHRGGPLKWFVCVSNPNLGSNNQSYKKPPYFYE